MEAEAYVDGTYEICESGHEIRQDDAQEDGEDPCS